MVTYSAARDQQDGCTLLIPLLIGGGGGQEAPVRDLTEIRKGTATSPVAANQLAADSFFSAKMAIQDLTRSASETFFKLLYLQAYLSASG